MNNHKPELILIFRTNIKSKKEAENFLSFLDKNEIIKWSIDLEDHDRVLRIVSSCFSAETISDLAERKGFECIELN